MKHILNNTNKGELAPWVTLDSEGVHYSCGVEEASQIELVDLGLPSGTLWASCNLGATKPEEYGDYYMWGSVTPNTDDVCDWEHTPYHEGTSSSTGWTKYNTKASYGTVDNKTVLDPEDDAAYVATGGKTHMPTKVQWDELLANTTNAWTTENGVNGRKFTASNGNSIFIPASGRRDGSSFFDQGSGGYVWSSSLHSGNPYNAWDLYFDSGNCDTDYDYRNLGFTVRPVSE